MNKRARNRLIGVTAIILIVIAAFFFASTSKGGGGGPAYYKTVTEVAKSNGSLVGTNITVGGPVVNGSWDKKTHPMRFTIADDKNKQATINVVYNGAVPNTFGDGVVAIVDGSLTKDGTLEATAMQTKCPDKEASKTNALGVGGLLKNAAQLKGLPLKVTGTVTPGTLVPPGSDVRFSIQDTTSTASALKVKFDGAPPAGFKDGAEVVLGGSLDPSGVFSATSVALAKK